jgi:hypothetical protein
MTRREFLKQATLAGGAVACNLPLPGAEAKVSENSKFILSAPLTHSDWMLKPGIAWGPEGVRHMLNACKACGWSRVHWRAFDGGRALYHSKLTTAAGKWDEDSFWNPQSDADKALMRRFTANLSDEKRVALRKQLDALDYTNFDCLAEAVRYGHQIGLQIHAWVTINEDDHGWGLQSDFTKKYPEFRWRGRGGKTYHSQLSFAYPEVRRYKLDLLKELLTNYELDGLFLDWIRTGDVRDNPQNDAEGVADYGYEKPLVEKFRHKFGKDPEKISNGNDTWVRFRAEPQTEFMRDVHKLVRRKKRKLPIAAMVGHPWNYRGEQNKIDGNLRGLLLDVKKWAHEGLIDAVIPAGYYLTGGNAESAWRALREETAGKVDVWMYAWVPGNMAEAESCFALAEKLGAGHILYWEADYIDDRTDAAAVKAALNRHAVL